MFKFIGLWCFLICGFIQSNAQKFDPKLSYTQSTNVLIEFTKQLKFKSNMLKVDSLAFLKPHTIHLFKTMPNCYQPKNRLPIFCEIEHQLSKLIKRRVKLGVP